MSKHWVVFVYCRTCNLQGTSWPSEQEIFHCYAACSYKEEPSPLSIRHCIRIQSIQARVCSSSIFSLMQNLCKTTMRFSPQRETWRSMARRKSSFTPFVIPRVTVWCLKPWRKERQTKSNHGYLVNYSHFKGTACHLLCIYGPYLSLFNENQRACAMLFFKNRV